MNKQHTYSVALNWTGNKGTGTNAYTAYERSHIISVENKPEIPCSSDPSFRGDKTRYNPEELLVASISSCHMLWYLHLCSEAGVVVTDYVDEAKGIMVETPDGGGHFTEVTLYPSVTIADPSMEENANALHEKANELCYIANSCNFPIHHKPSVKIKQGCLMSPKQVVQKWVHAFNKKDIDGLASLYTDTAINHQVNTDPLHGRDAIKKMFAEEFAKAEMVCIVENIFEDGDWAILEWKDPLGLRGCGFFETENDKIKFQRGYWDRLTFLRMHNLSIPQN